MKSSNITLRIRENGRWRLDTMIIILAIIMFASAIAVYMISTYTASQFHVYYSLDDRHNDQKIIKVIDEADRYIYFAIYYFTKTSIADALARAARRGVKVVGIMDRDASLNSNRRIYEQLIDMGITVLWQKHVDGIMHIKALVTEDAYASGSYNWTDGATNINDEVLEIGTNESVRKQYLSIIKNIITINQ